jgi:phosphosulfolactate synthase
VTGPGFLDLPPRSAKPRTAGLTHLLDKGTSLSELPGFLAAAASHIDLWKLGWGTSYLEPDPAAKVELLARHDIRACVGGTLLEAAWAQGKAKDLLGWAEDQGFPCVEVSNGAASMPLSDKRTLIAEAADRFVVLSEVGSKDPAVPVSAREWAVEMAGDLEVGASWVLTEGRESGTVGLYEADGSVRETVVDAVVEAAGVDRVVFEAPRKDQQAWFIRRFGPDVNLGNVALAEVVGLEALRLGLRADTIELSRRAGKP